MKSNFLILCLVTSWLLLYCQPAEPATACEKRFQRGGATPGADDCVIRAITSRAGLGNYGCGHEEAEKYCGPMCPKNEKKDSVSGECICKFGLRDYDTNACSKPPELGVYQEQTPGTPANADCSAIGSGALAFVFSPGTQQLPSALASNAFNALSILQMFELAKEAEAAENSGDSSNFFSLIADVIFPLFPEDSKPHQVFQDFSNFVDHGLETEQYTSQKSDCD